MALITCPNCSTQNSDAAVTCPNCGAAIGLAAESRVTEATLTATEQSGKPLQLHTLLSVVIFVIGLVLMIAKIYADSEPGLLPILLVLLGATWYLITRYRMRR